MAAGRRHERFMRTLERIRRGAQRPGLPECCVLQVVTRLNSAFHYFQSDECLVASGVSLPYSGGKSVPPHWR